MKKDILKDLEKFNNQLDKHLPGLDFNNVHKPKLNSSNYSVDDELFSLLTSNMMDIRTEISIMRKNMVNDVESMVMKTIMGQQNQFLEQANKFYGTIIGDLKQNFSNYILEMNSELSNLKKELNKVSIQNINFDNKLSTFNNNILEFKELANKFDLSLADNKRLLSPLHSNILELDSKFDQLNNTFNTSIKKQISNPKLSGDINLLNSKLEIISKKLSTRKTNNVGQKNIEILNSLKSEIVDSESGIHSDMDKLNSKLDNLVNSNKSKDKIQEKIVLLNNKNSKIKNHIHKSNSNINKILEIDSKLSKLNSLR